MNFLKHDTIKELIGDLRMIVDYYIARKVSKIHLVEYIKNVVEFEAEKLFCVEGFNPTVKQRLGSKRLKIIKDIIDLNNI